MDHSIRYRPLRAPRVDGQALIEPPLAAAGALIDANRAQSRAASVEIGGVRLSDLSAQARRELIATAYAHTTAYRDVPAAFAPQPGADSPVLLAGHQPELFHPGVWLKNFALGEIARRERAVPINLLVDSDAVKSTSIQVPTGTLSSPARTNVSFDRAGAEIPHEERPILDPEMFATFPQRVVQTLGNLVQGPLVEQLWPRALERMRADDNLGLSLARARHTLEGAWGAATLEVPQSTVCQLPSFHSFTAHLFAHLPRFWEHYNGALAEYRAAHRLRSTAHPVPDLASDGELLEAPYWFYTAERPQRRRLFVRATADEIVLTDRAGWEARLELAADGPSDRAVEQLASLANKGVKLRTRALATTLFARIVLGDLFLHGIGGAKYDQVTDRIAERFFGLAPPAYMTISATLLLFPQKAETADAGLRRIDQQLRELDFHPEKYLDDARPRAAATPVGSRSTALGDCDAQLALVAEKRHWIVTAKTSQNARARHFEIARINGALQKWIAPLREELQVERGARAAQARAAAILGSREYAFCLYNEATLRPRLLEFLQPTS